MGITIKAVAGIKKRAFNGEGIQNNDTVFYSVLVMLSYREDNSNILYSCMVILSSQQTPSHPREIQYQLNSDQTNQQKLTHIHGNTADGTNDRGYSYTVALIRPHFEHDFN